MTSKIELVDIVPTKQEIINYGKYISSLKVESDGDYETPYTITDEDYETPYTITDEELTQQKLNEYDEYCQEHGIDGVYLLASLITAKTFEMNKGGWECLK